MILVIEGPDKSGKTTLCQEIKEQYNFIYKKFPSEKIRNFILNRENKTISKIEKIIEDMEAFSNNIEKERNYIIDRWWISTLIYQGYNEIYRDKIIKLLEDSSLTKLNIDYLFYIKSNLNLERDNNDMYEENLNIFVEKYELLFSVKNILLNKYFNNIYTLYNRKGELKECLDIIYNIIKEY